MRPQVPAQLIRELVYVFAAVAPGTGEMVSLILPEASTAMMNLFLKEVSQTFSKYFIVMQVDGASCQDFAQKGPCFTLVQDHLEVTVGEQWAKATADVASPGVCASQADTLYSLVRQLDPPRNRPHLLDQPYDAIRLEP